MEINGLLQGMCEMGASDLFLKVPLPPVYKVAGQTFTSDLPPLTPNELDALVPKILRPRDQQTFSDRSQVDFSYSIPGLGRFRGNCYRQRGSTALVFRRINADIPTAEGLGLPDVVTDLAMEARGLVLLTGATGSGKSTTLAAMTDWRNCNTQGHIVTIEDPIEFLHTDKGCVVSQREVGVDVESYHDALKSAMRQAPNVLLLGEIRDAEAAETVLHLAETGHLVLSTLHSTNANQTIERILQFFPADRHPEVLSLLAFNLRGVISQRLIRGIDSRLHLVMEILIGTPRVRELLKRGDVGELKVAISQGDRDGMRTFDYSIFELYEQGLIDQESALLAADSPNDIKLRMRGFVTLGR